jgi:lactose/L-arabinose transport system substrate-binding protein
MMLKKSWGLFLMACILMSLFTAACSESKPAEKAEKGEAQQPELSSEKVKLVVWIWESAKIGLDLNMEDFKRQFPHIEIEFQLMKSPDMYQKFLVSSNTEDALPDIVALESTNLSKMVQIDSLLDITSRVQPYKDKINAYKWEDATKGGEIYAMPWDSGPVVMFYRNDVFAKAGLPTDPKEVSQRIQTWEDYYQVAKQIKEKTGVLMYGDSKTNSSNRMFESMMWQRGVWYFDKQGRVSVDTREVNDIADFLVKMQKEGLVYEARANTAPWENAIKAGEIATIVGGSWHDALIETQYTPSHKGKWSVAMMPKWSKDDKYIGANQGGSNLAINKNSKHPEESWKFIEFMLGKESSQVKMMTKAGLFPALSTVYVEPAINEISEYFNGQAIRKVYADTLTRTYPLAYTSDFPLANKLMTDVWAQIFLNNAASDKALKSMADELRQKTKRN